MNYSKLCNILMLARKQLNIDSHDIAFVLKTHPDHIEDLERGNCDISLKEYIKICDEYSLDPAEVLRRCCVQSPDSGNIDVDARLSRISECFHLIDETYKNVLLEFSEFLLVRHSNSK